MPDQDNRVYVVDVTLRDGAQTRGVNLSLNDKRTLAKMLDEVGVDIIEAGWPGANPMDTQLFNEGFSYLNHSQVTSFGMTRGAGKNTDSLAALTDNDARTVTFVGKASEKQVLTALETTPEENLAMIRDSVRYAKALGKTVVFDAEHFFDGYADKPEYAVSCLKTAQEAGADWLVLCDTNGGAVPWNVEKAVYDVKEALPGAKLGVHCHNDTGLATANTLAAVKTGARMVQVTLGGLGERCGNADLFQVVPDLVLKMGYDLGRLNENLGQLTKVYGDFCEAVGLKSEDNKPYVGKNAFAHKGGLHVSALLKDPDLYQHEDPGSVGNSSLVVSSNMSGTANMVALFNEIGVEVTNGDKGLTRLLDTVKQLEHSGFSFDKAPESLKLKALEEKGMLPNYFEVDDYCVTATKNAPSHARIKVKVGDSFMEGDAGGNGPVDALNNALQPVLVKLYPELKSMRLDDYKVEIVNSRDATAAKTRVFVSSIYDDGVNPDKHVCSTIGVHENILEASLNALTDAFKYMLVENRVVVNLEQSHNNSGQSPAGGKHRDDGAGNDELRIAGTSLGKTTRPMAAWRNFKAAFAGRVFGS